MTTQDLQMAFGRISDGDVYISRNKQGIGGGGGRTITAGGTGHETIML